MTSRSPRLVRVLTSALVLAAGLGAGVAASNGSASAADGSAPVVTFPHLHSVHSPATARRYLHGTSPSFKRFAAREGARVRRLDAGCQGNSGVYVEAFTRGYAIGAVGVCGGYQALWTNRVRGGGAGGHWREVFGSQDGLYCPVLKRYKVPSALVGTSCWSPSRHETIAYHQE
jgi:hypothetical protein